MLHSATNITTLIFKSSICMAQGFGIAFVLKRAYRKQTMIRSKNNEGQCKFCCVQYVTAVADFAENHSISLHNWWSTRFLRHATDKQACEVQTTPVLMPHGKCTTSSIGHFHYKFTDRTCGSKFIKDFQFFGRGIRGSSTRMIKS